MGLDGLGGRRAPSGAKSDASRAPSDQRGVAPTPADQRGVRVGPSVGSSSRSPTSPLQVRRARPDRAETLAEREVEVLRLLAFGYVNRADIAEKLFVSPGTLKSHLG